LGKHVTMTLNAVGQSTETVDQLGRHWKMYYDNDGRQTGAEDPNGTMTSTVYDADNNVIATKDGRGKWTLYEYDYSESADQDDRSQRQQHRDALRRQHNVTQTIDGEGEQTLYTYDKLNRQTEVTDPNGNTTTSMYDKGGQRHGEYRSASYTPATCTTWPVGRRLCGIPTAK